MKAELADASAIESELNRTCDDSAIGSARLINCCSVWVRPFRVVEAYKPRGQTTDRQRCRNEEQLSGVDDPKVRHAASLDWGRPPLRRQRACGGR